MEVLWRSSPGSSITAKCSVALNLHLHLLTVIFFSFISPTVQGWAHCNHSCKLQSPVNSEIITIILSLNGSCNLKTNNIHNCFWMLHFDQIPMFVFQASTGGSHYCPHGGYKKNSKELLFAVDYSWSQVLKHFTSLSSVRSGVAVRR
jgi:hypothetical protein